MDGDKAHGLNFILLSDIVIMEHDPQLILINTQIRVGGARHYLTNKHRHQFKNEKQSTLIINVN